MVRGALHGKEGVIPYVDVLASGQFQIGFFFAVENTVLNEQMMNRIARLVADETQGPYKQVFGIVAEMAAGYAQGIAIPAAGRHILILGRSDVLPRHRFEFEGKLGALDAAILDQELMDMDVVVKIGPKTAASVIGYILEFDIISAPPEYFVIGKPDSGLWIRGIHGYPEIAHAFPPALFPDHLVIVQDGKAGDNEPPGPFAVVIPRENIDAAFALEYIGIRL